VAGLALGRPAAVASLAAAPLVLGLIAGEPTVAASGAGGGLVLAGVAAIRLARGRWMTAPHLMLLLCFAGMALGLLADRQIVLPAALVSLCTSETGFLASIVDHWATLPTTNFGMIFGGFATILVVEMRAAARPAVNCRRAVCARAGFNLMCNAAMLAGMLAGGWVAPRLAVQFGMPWSVSAMMAAMAAGMVWGMAALVAVYRSAIAIWAQLDRHPLAAAVPRTRPS
jgi:hypothetical protein